MMLPILPLHAIFFFRQAWQDLLCLSSFVIGGFSIIGMIFHLPLYPSYNTINDSIQTTWFGSLRSNLADFLLQFYGYSGIFFGVFFLVIGFQILASKALSIHFFRRFFFLHLALIFINCVLCSWPRPYRWWGNDMVGSIGLLMNDGLRSCLTSLSHTLHIPSTYIGFFAAFNIVFFFFAIILLQRSLHFSLKSLWIFLGSLKTSIAQVRFFSPWIVKPSIKKLVTPGEVYSPIHNMESNKSHHQDHNTTENLGFFDNYPDTHHQEEDHNATPHQNLMPHQEELHYSGAVDEFDYYPQTISTIVSNNLKTITKSKEHQVLKRSQPKNKDQDVLSSLAMLGNTGVYTLPSLDLLTSAPISPTTGIQISAAMLDKQSQALQDVLEEFSVRGEIVNARPGPVVTLFEFKPAPGIKTARVISLADDIARSMSVLSARIAVVPGQNLIGIELPNKKRQTVFLKELLEAPVYSQGKCALPLILGQDIGGQPVVVDLAKMPHLLVAGTTGSGKSVSINVMILSLLFRLSPEQCKFIMIDPKMLELSVYDDIPHLLTPVVTDPKKAVIALKWAVKEMERRYRSMSKLGVRNIDSYNERIHQARQKGSLLTRRVQTGFDPDTGKPIFENQALDFENLPYIVVIVDEMADLMLVAGKEIEGAVQRLAQMARAAGIHLIMATQRPSVDVITGTIKANFPTRVSFQVTSKIDSRTILGEQGAEQLLGQGDMLYMAGGGRIKRVHGPFVKDLEVERIVESLKSQGEPSYIETITQEDDDQAVMDSSASQDNGKNDLYRRAVDLILREQKVSTSFVQRHLEIGYNRAAKIVEQMEKEGLISAANHSGKRTILGNM